MPYIITTRAQCPDCNGRGRVYDRIGKYDRVCNRCSLGDVPSTRTAVATLEEARSIAHPIVHEVYRQAYPLKPRGLGGEHRDAQRAHRWHNVDVDKLPAHGGTIGPLPDGTVIEVRYESELPTGPRKFYCGECEVIHRDSTDCRA